MIFVIGSAICIGLEASQKRRLHARNENRYHSSAMHEDPKNAYPSRADAFQGRRPRPERTSSEALLGAAQELIIEHDGREYRLRITQQGKLILTA
jgi:hemin uptake protein HemP